MRISHILLVIFILFGYSAPVMAQAQAPVPQELLEQSPDNPHRAAPTAPQAQTQQQQIQSAPAIQPPAVIREGDTIEANPRPMPKRNQNPAGTALPFQSYSDIPDEALADMQDFHKFCTNNDDLSLHFDCDCWGSRYLEERIKAGPNVSRQQLILRLSGECFNIPGAAGYGYGQCMQYGELSYTGGMTPEEYCECTGRNYAILIQRQAGFLNKVKMNSMMSSALLRCRASTPNTRNLFNRLDTHIINRGQ